MVKLFKNIYHLIQKQRRLFIIGLLICFGCLVWVASHIQFDENISKLIPTNSDNQQLQKVLNTAHFSDKIVINISREPQGTLEDMTEYAQQLLDSLNEQSNAYIKDILGKFEDEIIFETLDIAFENAPLFLSDEDYNILSDKTQQVSIEKSMEANYKTLVSPSGMLTKKTISRDPLGISLLALQHLKQLGFSDDFELKNGFLISKDGQNILLFISPTYQSSETKENEILAAQLYRYHQDLNHLYKEKVMSEAFGGSLIAVANAQQIKKDIQWTVTMALVALLALFIFFYNKLTIPLILLVPTIFGGLLSVAILYLIRKEISAISLGIGAVLLGVTLDYALHVLTHIRNNDNNDNLYADVAKPILMSSLTTALAFLCLLFIDSQALQDLGIFAAVSVLGASVFALIFIPQVYHGKAVTSTRKNTFVDSIANYPFHQNKTLIGCLIVLLIVSAFTYHKVEFNNDISKINYQPPHLKVAETNLGKLTNETAKSLYVMAYGNSMQDALEANDRIFANLSQLQAWGNIISFNSVAALVSSKASQLEKIDRWNKFWTPEKARQTEQLLMESGQKFGFRSNSFNEFYQLMHKEFDPLEVEDFKSFRIFPVDDFIASKDGFYTVTSVVKVEDDQIPFIQKSFENKHNSLVIDRQNLNETLLGHLKSDFNTLMRYCFVVILVLLLLFYRNIKLTLITVIPIVITWLITIGVIGLLGVEFNIFSMLISTFIFGLGVDYSIFMTNGLLKQKMMDDPILKTHKTSVLLSVLTTVLGIGVLIFAKHPALYSISVVSMIGILSAMLIAFTIHPLLFKLLIFDRKRHP